MHKMPISKSHAQLPSFPLQIRLFWLVSMNKVAFTWRLVKWLIVLTEKVLVGKSKRLVQVRFSLLDFVKSRTLIRLNKIELQLMMTFLMFDWSVVLSFQYRNSRPMPMTSSQGPACHPPRSYFVRPAVQIPKRFSFLLCKKKWNNQHIVLLDEWSLWSTDCWLLSVSALNSNLYGGKGLLCCLLRIECNNGLSTLKS